MEAQIKIVRKPNKYKVEEHWGPKISNSCATYILRSSMPGIRKGNSNIPLFDSNKSIERKQINYIYNRKECQHWSQTKVNHFADWFYLQNSILIQRKTMYNICFWPLTWKCSLSMYIFILGYMTVSSLRFGWLIGVDHPFLALLCYSVAVSCYWWRNSDRTTELWVNTLLIVGFKLCHFSSLGYNIRFCMF